MHLLGHFLSRRNYIAGMMLVKDVYKKGSGLDQSDALIRRPTTGGSATNGTEVKQRQQEDRQILCEGFLKPALIQNLREYD